MLTEQLIASMLISHVVTPHPELKKKLWAQSSYRAQILDLKNLISASVV